MRTNKKLNKKRRMSSTKRALIKAGLGVGGIMLALSEDEQKYLERDAQRSAQKITELKKLFEQHEDFVAEKDEELRQRLAATNHFQDVRVHMDILKKSPDLRTVQASRTIEGLPVCYDVVCKTHTKSGNKQYIRLASQVRVGLHADMAKQMSDLIKQDGRLAKYWVNRYLNDFVLQKSKKYRLAESYPESDIPSFDVEIEEPIMKPLKGDVEALWLRTPTEYDLSSEMLEKELRRLDKIAYELAIHQKTVIRMAVCEAHKQVLLDEEETARLKAERLEEQRAEEARRLAEQEAKANLASKTQWKAELGEDWDTAHHTKKEAYVRFRENFNVVSVTYKVADCLELEAKVHLQDLAPKALEISAYRERRDAVVLKAFAWASKRVAQWQSCVGLRKDEKIIQMPSETRGLSDQGAVYELCGDTPDGHFWFRIA